MFNIQDSLRIIIHVRLCFGVGVRISMVSVLFYRCNSLHDACQVFDHQVRILHDHHHHSVYKEY